MNLYQCQKHAERNGFDSDTFVAHFPTGAKECQWLDAYFGMFKIKDLASDGFVTVSQIDDMFPTLECTLNSDD